LDLLRWTGQERVPVIEDDSDSLLNRLSDAPKAAGKTRAPPKSAGTAAVRAAAAKVQKMLRRGRSSFAIVSMVLALVALTACLAGATSDEGGPYRGLAL